MNSAVKLVAMGLLHPSLSSGQFREPIWLQMMLLNDFTLTYGNLDLALSRQSYRIMATGNVTTKTSVNADSSNINFILPLLDNLFKPKERFIPEKEMHMRSKRYKSLRFRGRCESLPSHAQGSVFLHRLHTPEGWSVTRLAPLLCSAHFFLPLYQFDTFGAALPFQHLFSRGFRWHGVPRCENKVPERYLTLDLQKCKQYSHFGGFIIIIWHVVWELEQTVGNVVSDL